jgi:phosphohistidine phosphatase SixA
VDIQVHEADALDFSADVLVLTYPQALYGVTKLVVERIESAGIGIQNLLPAGDACRLVDTKGQTAAARVLLVGVVTFNEFGYSAIRGHARRALASLGKTMPAATHVAFTLHGAGYGLDEAESFRSEVAGMVDAVESKEHPPKLSLISVVERHGERAQRLQVLLESIFPGSPADTVTDEPGIARRRMDPARAVGLPPEIRDRARSVVELYLIGEGSAKPGKDGLPSAERRELSVEEVETFRRLVEALRRRGLMPDAILTSPAPGARQSAELLAEGLSHPPPVHVLRSLAPGGNYEMFLTDLRSQKGRRLACIGHELALGRLASRLAGIRHELPFEYASVCRIDLDLQGPGRLVWFAPPSILCSS